MEIGILYRANAIKSEIDNITRVLDDVKDINGVMVEVNVLSSRNKVILGNRESKEIVKGLEHKLKCLEKELEDL